MKSTEDVDEYLERKTRRRPAEEDEMSRPNRAGLPTSSASTTTGATGGTGIPVPVVQQAQQYLEETSSNGWSPRLPRRAGKTVCTLERKRDSYPLAKSPRVKWMDFSTY
ncbi:hypothetical protein CEXT_667911 [Caerostris extrusa]|uniref:Uncharacterized protein n=1 Tax=Caerostris extrusa TaxID=172846 RepID=A0AAV4SHY5_CAEEX|nr:hypothetical protein CEXT_667911 [Caerostris extrusa]